MEIRANSIKITLALAILFTPLTGLHGGEQTASKSEWFKKYVPLATGIYLVALGGVLGAIWIRTVHQRIANLKQTIALQQKTIIHREEVIDWQRHIIERHNQMVRQGDIVLGVRPEAQVMFLKFRNPYGNNNNRL